jgi:hypothetical protein
METFQIALTLAEVQTLRQSLEQIAIAGKDAKFLAALQVKLEGEIQIITQQLNTKNTPGKK